MGLCKSISCFRDFVAEGASAGLIPCKVQGETFFEGVAFGSGFRERVLEGL